MIIAILVGAFVGAVCVLGLQLGMKILIEETLDERPKSRAQKARRYGLAILYLGGQLAVALVVLFKVPWPREHSLGLALGLIAAIFAVSYLREDAGDSAGDVADKNPSDKQE